MYYFEYKNYCFMAFFVEHFHDCMQLGSSRYEKQKSLYISNYPPDICMNRGGQRVGRQPFRPPPPCFVPNF